MVQDDNINKIRSLISHKEIDAVNGTYSPFAGNKRLLSKFQNLYTHNNYVRVGGRKYQVFYKSFWASFSAIKKEVFQDVGGFDESLIGLEDIEFGVRLIQKGYRVLLDKRLQNIHNHNFTFKKFFYNYYNKTIAWVNISFSKGLLKYDGYDDSVPKLSLISANMFFLALFGSLAFINLVPILLLLPLSLLSFFCLINYNFFILAKKTYGLSFMLVSVPLLVSSYLFIACGIFGGLINYLIKTNS